MSRLPPLDPAARPRLRLPLAFFLACRRTGAALTPAVLWVDIARQRMWLFAQLRWGEAPDEPDVRTQSWSMGSWYSTDGSRERSSRLTHRFSAWREYVISTSRFGIGEVANSNMTPRGLHRIARKIGGGWPVGTVFKSRQVVGFTWQGLPNASIVHRIFWLEGLEPGYNRGGHVDTFTRYIYVHGFGDEPTRGRPASHGCIHVSAADLVPLYDALPEGTLVWISER